MRLSQRDKILRLLTQRRGKLVNMRRLNDICFRYGARISDLRKQGYKIDTIQLGVGNFAYRLVQ